MATFPALKCGSVAQYPMDRTFEFSTGVVRFMDGSEQRFPKYRSVLKRWRIMLSLLDEGELQKIEEFYLQQSGQYGTFVFVDPWDLAEHPTCSFQAEKTDGIYDGFARASADLVIVENR